MNREQLKQFMNIALEESKNALPHCKPNPPVGCVLVKENEVIAKGFTQPPGSPHAEAMVLNKIEGDLSDVSVFVTLEPCSFFGRTPSCATALVERKIKDIYVGILDPDPKNNGKGLDILKEAGIPTKLGVLKFEVMEFLVPHLKY